MRLIPSSAAARRRLLRWRRSASVMRTTSASSLADRSIDRPAAAGALRWTASRGAAGNTGAARRVSGRSAIWIMLPGQRATARSMTLRSSRMLPGQS
jgi:hypothetical protein